MKTKEFFLEKEQRRQEFQSALDAAKTQAERNRMGQFATPPQLALDILAYAKRLTPKNAKISFFDPALGTGTFYSALLQCFPVDRIEGALGCEIDADYAKVAVELWKDCGLDVQSADFTKVTAPENGANLIICNPPYVRHHHMANDEKVKIQAACQAACGVSFNGLTGLYCYFLGLSHGWMADGGLAGWLIPSEFMDVNYGEALKRYLLEKVTLLHIHRFDPQEVQFSDALVSSAVVWFKKISPSPAHEVTFSFGGTLLSPRVSRLIPVQDLRAETKWTRFPLNYARPKSKAPVLSDFFSIRRGVATGDNDFFIMTAEQIAERKLPREFFRPILPSPRYLKATTVFSDRQGNPKVERPVFLLDCRFPEEQIKKQYPSLWAYFQEGVGRGVADRYLCSHRSLWYLQENRPSPPLLCTYIGRGNVKSGRPFRFILNQSRATVTNVYLALYPKEPVARALAADPSLLERIWDILNNIHPQDMIAEGRVYGGGMHKLEPKELANVPVSELSSIFPL
jgi:predicted RNA methylase